MKQRLLDNIHVYISIGNTSSTIPLNGVVGGLGNQALVRYSGWHRWRIDYSLDWTHFGCTAVLQSCLPSGGREESALGRFRAFARG